MKGAKLKRFPGVFACRKKFSQDFAEDKKEYQEKILYTLS